MEFVCFVFVGKCRDKTNLFLMRLGYMVANYQSRLGNPVLEKGKTFLSPAKIMAETHQFTK